MYLRRHIEDSFRSLLGQFPVVVLSGARQVGKSTMLKELFSNEYQYVSFDDIRLREQAKSSPDLFLRNFTGKVIFDEIQYVPELFSEIKLIVDKDKEKGRYILTGSQQFHMIKNLRETLAGRAVIMSMSPMTSYEMCGKAGETHWITNLLEKNQLKPNIRIPETLSPDLIIRRGGLPELIDKDEKFWNIFFESYIKTYIERDLPFQYDVVDNVKLSQFLRLLAPYSSQEINRSQMGREINISSPTAARWLQWLSGANLWTEIPAYHGNMIKRVSKSPKGSLFDTGLVCHLLQLSDRNVLLSHPFVGALFETAIRNELATIISSGMIPASIWHWRTPQGQEVDIVIEYKNRLYAFECKWNPSIRPDDMKGLLNFKKYYGNKVAFMGVLTSYGHQTEIGEGIFSIPWFQK